MNLDHLPSREPETVTTPTEAVERAEAHLKLLRSYFAFQAYVGILAGGLILISPITGATVTIHGRPWLTLPLVAATTWAAYRTRILLGERNRQGLWMALITFASNLVTAASAREFGWGAVFATLGILLSVNVARHLRELDF